jgi:hypothetical protein
MLDKNADGLDTGRYSGSKWTDRPIRRSTLAGIGKYRLCRCQSGSCERCLAAWMIPDLIACAGADPWSLVAPVIDQPRPPLPFGNHFRVRHGAKARRFQIQAGGDGVTGAMSGQSLRWDWP